MGFKGGRVVIFFYREGDVILGDSFIFSGIIRFGCLGVSSKDVLDFGRVLLLFGRLYCFGFEDVLGFDLCLFFLYFFRFLVFLGGEVYFLIFYFILERRKLRLF